MDKARARALLDQERRRLEQLGRAVARDHDDAVAASRPEDPVDGADRRVAEETSEALGERLGDRWGALERAEARLAAGTYGASILSGRPIPDERLEAFPLAELTVQEAAQRDRSLGERREPESRMGPSRDPFRVFDDPAAQDDGLVEEEGSDDEPGPWSAGSSGGWSEACGYRWITMQVRMRVTPSTTWMGRPPAAQVVQTWRLNPGDEVVGAGEILGELRTIQVAERLATWATLATSVSMSTYALSIAQASSAFSHATL